MSSTVTHGRPSIWLLRISAPRTEKLDFYELAQSTADTFAEIMRIVCTELGAPYQRCFEDFVSSWTPHEEGIESSSFRIHDLVFKRQHFGGYTDAAPYMVIGITKLLGDTPLTLEIGLPMLFDDVYDSRVAVLSVLTTCDDQSALDSPLVQIVLQTLRASHVEGPYSHPLVEPSHTLQTFLDYEYARTVSRVNVVLEGIEKDMERRVKDFRAQSAKQQRKVLRQLEQTATQLDTARAVSDRERAKATAAEKAMKDLRLEQSSGHSQAVPNAAADHAHELREEIADLELRLRQMREERDASRQEVFALQLRIDADEVEYEQDTHSVQEFPTSIDEVAGWAEMALDSTRIVLHTRANRFAKKSAFRDPSLVARVLQALCEHYWPMKMEGDSAAGEAWSSFLVNERLECGLTGAAVTDHRTSDSYHVRVEGRRLPLDMHVSGSDARRPEECLRIYFHADKQTKRIVVGHYPSHLRNSLS